LLRLGGESGIRAGSCDAVARRAGRRRAAGARRDVAQRQRRRARRCVTAQAGGASVNVVPR
jgi:hypothetical protein